MRPPRAGPGDSISQQPRVKKMLYYITITPYLN